MSAHSKHLVLCLAALLGGPALPRPVGAAEAPLPARVSEHISQPRFAAAAWGVKIVSLDTGKTLFDHNGGKLLKPASNAKLYTGALALDRLGPDFRIKTSLYATARPDSSGTVRGDVVVYGRGDPSFAARFHDGDHSKSLAPLVEALAAAGVKRIKGDLIGDESFFRGPPLGSGWTWDDLQYYYGAEASALTVDDNVVDLTFQPGARIGAPCRIIPAPATGFLTFDNRTTTAAAGVKRDINLHRPIGENIVHVTGRMALGDTNFTDAVTVHRPARWFITRLKESLARRGITVSGGVRTVDWRERAARPVDLTKLVELAAVQSPPLAEIVTKMMKPSQNLYAHLLLLQVGARNQHTAATEATTEDGGLAEMKSFLAEAGTAPGEVLLEEGSGLSRAALVTPNATVALLRFMDRHRHAEYFRAALPLAGVDGTLRNRMRGTRAAENVQAKTGSLRYVNTLSGYVTTRAGERLVFSILLNNYLPPPGASARDDIDAIALMLAELETRL